MDIEAGWKFAAVRITPFISLIDEPVGTQEWLLHQIIELTENRKLNWL
jgi:hypothetical protein